MASVPQATDSRPTAERLARDLRSGLQFRWTLPTPALNAPHPFPPRGQVRPFLEPYSDSLHARIPRGRRLLDALLRPMRYLTRKIIAPWLNFQTHFNLSAVSVLEQVEQRVRALEEAERALRQTLETLGKKSVDSQ